MLFNSYHVTIIRSANQEKSLKPNSIYPPAFIYLPIFSQITLLLSIFLALITFETLSIKNFQIFHPLSLGGVMR